MSWGRGALFVMLAVVAGAAAVLSFDALRELALVCGFDTRLAWLLPIVVDAGAAAGSLVWLGSWAPEPARRFARVLALLLLGGSVAGNALGHGLEAFGAAAAWWVVVTVSAVPPAVLGAVVHLAVLASGRQARQVAPSGLAPVVEDLAPVVVADDHAQDQARQVPAPGLAETPDDRAARLIAEGYGRKRLADALAITEPAARTLIEQHRTSTNGVAR